MTLPDIQQTKPNINIPIKQVGVENVIVPFILKYKYGGYKSMNVWASGFRPKLN